jgi:hypothetical protein
MTILEVKAVSADQETIPIETGNLSQFALDIRMNHGAGTQTLAGTLKLQGRADPNNSTWVDMGEYIFTSNPAGTSYAIALSFCGAVLSEYRLYFTRSSGTGDVTVCAVVK